MKELIQQTKWQFILLQKNNIISISIAVTFFYALAFFITKDLGNADKVLTLLIFNDPAVIGLFFIGLSIIMEKDQQVLSALFVTPINHHIYLISRILSISIVGWVCALGMAFAAVGNSFHLIHFSAGVLGICILACLLGIYLVCYTQEFMRFTLKSIPILLLLFNLPLLNYFEVTNIGFFKFFPSQGGVDLIAGSHEDSPDPSVIFYGYLSIVFWIPLLYWLVYRTFMSKIVNV